MKKYLLIYLLLLLGAGATIAQPKVSDLTSGLTGMSGATFKWYSADYPGGTLFTGSENLVNGQKYYAAQVVNGVESTSRKEVTAIVNSVPTPTFIAQPGATAYLGTDVTYTTESGKSNYVWTFPGTVNVDYTITSGGTSTDNSVTLNYLTTGNKTVTINYTANGCTAASATSSTATTVSMIPPGNALAFDGSNDYVNAGNGASVKLTQGTLEAWIKTSGTGNTSNIITKPWAYGLFLYYNQLAVYDWNTGWKNTNINLADGRWHHVAFSFNSGVTNGSFVYVDGELKLTTTYSISNQDHSLGIGALTNNGGELFTGTIDEARVWNTVRSQADIQSTMYAEMAGNESGLLLNYDFNQGVAGGNNTGITTLFDKTSNAINGTLMNFTKTGSTSNFVESYAMVVPVPTAASDITSTGFTANWTAPAIGTVSSYKLDVSTSSTFGSFVTGYNGLDCGTSLSQSVSGLTAGITYYYRVRADITSLTGSGGYYRTPVVTTTALAIGDAYQGGIVIYLDGTGQHGLIAATTDQSNGIAWITGGSTQTTLNGNTSTAFGTGQANTNYMKAQTGYTGGAAQVCDDYTNTDTGTGVYSDWYLPSKDELNQIYLQKAKLSGFASEWYWSSSENSYNLAWAQRIDNGQQGGGGKDNTLFHVRAVRTF